MNAFGDQGFDDHLRNAVSGAPPSSVEERLQNQLAGFQSRLSATLPGTAPAPVRHSRRRVWRVFGVTCTAAAALAAVVVGLSLRPQTSFAQVAAAVLEQPWVHTQTVDAGGQSSEMWYSPSKEISAWREPGSVRYEDYRLQIYHSYDPAENVVYRGPVVDTFGSDDFHSMAEAIKIVVQREQVPDQPLTHLGFLGPERSKMKVLEQGVKKVNDGEHTWLDYRITVSYEDSAKPLQFLFRVDTRTKLPALCRIETELAGKPAVRESRFDYPERGPADIYDLGVPRTTKLVDRLPSRDLDRILKTLQAGRARMDSYRAVFAKEYEGIGHHWWKVGPTIFYRKGNVFRADYSVREIGDPRAVKPPADGENLHKWWFERTGSFQHFTMYVLRDSVMYTSNTKTVADADGSQHFEIASVSSTRFGGAIPGETFPAEYAMRPEFACRPPMGIGNPHQEPVLELHPSEGPAGCILLTVGHTTKADRVNEKGVGLADKNRFWLDPQRDHIVVRWEMVIEDSSGKEKIINSYIVEETARSPQGVWYATKVRRKNVSRDKDGKQFDEIDHIYVDFDVNLPDDFFKAQAPGRIY